MCKPRSGTSPRFSYELRQHQAFALAGGDVEARSDLAFDLPAPRTLRLHQGSLAITRPALAGPPTAIDTGGIRIQFVGGRLLVSQRRSGVEVRLLEGATNIHVDGRVVPLKPGEVWPRRDEKARGQTEVRRARSSGARKGQVEPSGTNAFEAAAAAVRAEDWDRARAAYRRLSAQQGPEAETALFLWADVEVQSGRYLEALRLLGQQRARFLNGALAPERALRRVRVLLKIERCEEAASVFRVAAERYVYPAQIHNGLKALVLACTSE